ncbi:3-deoxy-manno-octulosonate cytidylyltransferase [Pararhodonellum marinum]|uniref:3-deoxy-manno-octulosonate cytidylyltransferase n=1 Tax=Pararhodonellum marinum TaxID=2755358 RepID=UPI00188DEBCE|nr:3-deoxy-manno-octulosonate cytidylyltransferase [Pararhodonellum marinum]
MKSIALIPARYASTRFPAKLTADLCGKSVIQRTYLSTVATGIFNQVIVVTDHSEIASHIEELGGTVFFSQKIHESGSDRIAEAAATLDADVVVNVQGDEPFQDKTSLENLLEAFKDPEVQVASLMFSIDTQQAEDPNAVKVVLDKAQNALYFSRAKVPFARDSKVAVNYFKHIGIYAYRKDVLIRFTQLDKSHLEQIEMLEQLRLLENGIPIRMVETTHQAIAVDVPEDLELAKAYFRNYSDKI